MHPSTNLICGIGLLIASIVILRISWNSLTFQENEEQEYDLQDLALYGGRFCAVKNFCRGLAGIFTGKHQVLRLPSMLLLVGSSFMVGGILLLYFAQN
jgi:hypothetical protein